MLSKFGTNEKVLIKRIKKGFKRLTTDLVNKYIKEKKDMEKRRYETPSFELSFFSTESVLMASSFSNTGFAAFKNTWLGKGGEF